jgi:hypothetical protein
VARDLVPRLTESHPQIAVDWDCDKNDPLAPNQFGSHDKTRVWWKCKNGHRYQVSISTRVRTNGCKFCNPQLSWELGRRAKLAKSGSFADARPDLVGGWDRNRNSLGPDEVSAHSHKKLYFICLHGHSYLSTPQRRMRGHGCPTCYRDAQSDVTRERRFNAAGISFAQKYPELLAEWDYAKNKLDPNRLAPQSGVYAYWKCKFGHEWRASISNRTTRQSGCPHCVPASSRLEIRIYAELQALIGNVGWREKIDGFECDILLRDQCIGVEVDGSYWHAGKLEKDTAKTLALKRKGVHLIRLRQHGLPEIAGDVIPFKGTEKDGALLFPLAQHLYELTGDQRFHTYAMGQRIVADPEYRELVARLPSPASEDTLAARFPDLAAEWDYTANAPLRPELFSPGSDQRMAWICSKGHKWYATIKNRTLRNSGCPECSQAGSSNRVVKWRLRQAGTLATKDPEMLGWWDSQYNSIDPTKISARSITKAYWRCPKGHRFIRAVCTQSDKRRCPECYRSARAPLGAVLGRLPFKPVGIADPDLVSVQSNALLEWECPIGHRFHLPPRRAVHRKNCPVCAGYAKPNEMRKLGVTVAEKVPTLVDEWADAQCSPFGVRATSKRIIKWRCRRCGHSWQAQVRDRTRGSGCPICSRRMAAERTRIAKLAKSGSLAQKAPTLVSQFDTAKNVEVTIDSVSASSHRKLWWKCRKGHEWRQSPNQRLIRGRITDCPICAKENAGTRRKEQNAARKANSLR